MFCHLLHGGCSLSHGTRIGARLADYKQDNPAKLASGYGGTINLMLSLLLTGLLLVGAAVPLLRESAQANSPIWLWAAGAGWCIIISGLWTFIGLRMARKWCGLEPDNRTE